MSFLKCNYEDHEYSEIKHVCMEKDCKFTRWVCLGCKLVYHKNHQLMNIDQFKDFIRQKNESFNKVRNYLGNLLQQVKILDSCIKNITLLNEDHLESLSLNQLDEQLNYLIIFSQAEPELINNIDKVKPFNGSIEKIIECFKQNLQKVSARSFRNLNIQNLDIPTLNSERIIRSSHQGRTISRQNIMTNRNSNVHELLLPSVQIPIKDLRFQDPINFEKIRIYNNRKSGAGNGKILCDPRLFENSCVQYGFIWEDGYNLGIGICSKSEMMKNFYKPILEQVRHGIYMINSKGNVYSHDNEAINNIRINVTFKQNELIVLQIDMPHNQITWLNQEREQLYSMKIKILDQMYVLLDLLGTVKIIDI